MTTRSISRWQILARSLPSSIRRFSSSPFLSSEFEFHDKTAKVTETGEGLESTSEPLAEESIVQHKLSAKEKKVVIRSFFPEKSRLLQSIPMSPQNRSSHPSSPHSLTISKLLAAGLHLGHSTHLWNPASLPFIFGTRMGISIINLEHTLIHLRRACTVVNEISLRGGIILFVGTRPGFSKIVLAAAERCEGYHVSMRWIPGTLTNGIQVLGRHALVDPKDPTKPPRIFKPDLIICLNPVENAIMLEEAVMENVPVIAITDTDFDPKRVMYPIPGNDDSLRGVELVAGVLSVAAREGMIKRKAELSKRDRTKDRVKEISIT